MSLSNEDIEKIKEQEQYRLLIREELESNRPNSTKEVIWQFLNSAFGLFLMSSIFIGGLSWGYGLFEKSQKISSEQAALLKKSKLEISYRISPLFSLYKENGEIDNLVLSDLKHIFGSEPPENHDFMVSEARALFPELKSRNIVSLFYVIVLNDEGKQAKKAKQVILLLNKFERMMKSAPKQEINLADHVVDEVPVFSKKQNSFIKTSLIPTMDGWK